MSFVDRERAARLLEAAGLDALVVAEPEGFHTVTGASQGVAGLFRRAGAGFAVLPADPALPIGAVAGDLQLDVVRRHVPDALGHPLWIEHADVRDAPADGPLAGRIARSWTAGRPPGLARPATFDLRLSLAALREVLAARGLAEGRLGVDLAFVSAQDARVVADGLTGATVLDGSPAFDRLRMVKTAAETERLTLALALSEAGLRALASGVREGQDGADLHALYRAGVETEAARRGVAAPQSWDYIGIGPEPWGAGGRVAPGSVIKADVGCVVDGYSSDTSRNYVFAAPSPGLGAFHALLEEAMAAGLAAIRPGVPLATAHAAATAVLHAGGLAGFSRGHLGHGLGHAVFSEQWPFIAQDAETPFEPGMVMAFEVPIYVTGLGGFNLEDQLIVEPEGARVMTELPRGLTVLAG